MNLVNSHRGEPDRPASRAASLNSFIGEDPETTLRPRTPTSTTSATETASNRSSTATPDPSKWGQDQQEQFMRALFGAGLAGQAGGLPPNLLQGATDPTASQIPEMPHDPLAMLMAQMAGPQSAAGGSPFGPTTHASAGIPSFPGMNFPGPPIQPSGPPKPKSLVQKLMPLVHLLASFALLLYFIFWAEAGAFAERAGASVLTGSDGKAESQWRRWAELGWRGAENGGWGVQAAVSHYLRVARCTRSLTAHHVEFFPCVHGSRDRPALHAHFLRIRESICSSPHAYH